ncbi:MAG: hypothetical protein V3S25_00635 [Nitrospirales bacterium]
MEILGTLAFAALMMLMGATVYVVRAVVSHRFEPPAPPVHASTTQERLGALESDFGRVLVEVERLKFAIAEGIERTDRAEKRIRKSVSSARRLVTESGLEHPGLEAEDEEIRARDGEGILPLSPLPTGLEESRTIRIPGGSLEVGA